MLDICGVYKIQSLMHPDRCYIGSSVNINNRFYRHKTALKHKWHHSPILQSHYDKYGIEDLVFSIVATCKREELIPINGTIWIEQCFIWAYAHDKHNKEKPYFNVDTNAGNRINHVDSDETKEKRHNSMLGKKNALGNKLSSEVIEKIRIAQIEINKSEAVRENKRQKMRGRHLGKKTSDETKKKQSEAHKNISDETRQKMSDSKKGTVPWSKGKTGIFSEETIRQMRETRKGRIPWNKNKKLGFTPSGAFKKGMIPWNKGLTKDTNESLRKISKSMEGNQNRIKHTIRNIEEESINKDD